MLPFIVGISGDGRTLIQRQRNAQPVEGVDCLGTIGAGILADDRDVAQYVAELGELGVLDVWVVRERRWDVSDRLVLQLAALDVAVIRELARRPDRLRSDFTLVNVQLARQDREKDRDQQQGQQHGEAGGA